MLTLVANNIDVSPMLGNTHRMVLHARAAADIAHHEDLDVLILRLFGWMIASWVEGGEPAEDPDQTLQAVGERDNAEAARDHGEDKCGRHACPGQSWCCRQQSDTVMVAALVKWDGL